MANQNIPAIQQKAGNVGIGTISPSAKLHVSGADIILRNAYIGEVSTYGPENTQFSHISRAGAGEYSFLSANDGTTFINAKTGYEIRFRVNNSDKIVMDSSGNLGIGDTSPGVYKLKVNGDVNFSGVLGVGSYIDVSGVIYHRSNINVLNKAGNAWLTWASRDTNGTDAVMNLANIGTLATTGSAILSNPSYGRKIYYRYIVPPTSTGNSTHDVYLGRISYGVTRITIYGDGYGAENAVCFEISRNWGIGTVPYINIRHGNLPQIVSLHHQAVSGEVAYSDIFMKYTYNAPNGYANNMYAVIETEGLSSWSIASPTTPTLNDANKLPLALYASLGNVGVGTTSPSYKLDVNGDIIIPNGSYYYARRSTSNDAIGVLGFAAGSDTLTIKGGTSGGATSIQFQDTGGTIAVFHNSNLGIGTTVPSNALSIGANPHTSPSSGESNRILNWYTVGSELGNNVIPVVVGNNNNSTSQPQMIGLSLFNRSTTDNTWSPAITFGGLSTSGDYMNGAAGIAAQLPTNSDNNFRGGNLVFYTSGIGANKGLIEKMRIQHDGNIGVGTTLPDSILQLGSKATSTQPFLTLARVATGGYWAGIDWNDGSTNTVKVYSDGNNGLNINVKVASDLQFSTNNTERMRVTSGGSVGIGTTNPGYPLDLGTGGTGNSIRARRIWANGTGTDSGFTVNNTLIYQSAAGNFHITDPGSYPNILLTLTTGSSVGIGTVSPNYKLDVNGVVNATDYYFNNTSTQRVTRRYISTANLDSSGYTVICNVVGSNLASAVRVTLQGTAGNTVINVTADILVNHYQDILITSQAGIYTVVTLRVKSNNDETFSIEATTNSPYTCVTNVEVYPLNSESVTFGGAAQTGATLTHTCRPGVNISATGGSDGNFAASGDGYFGGSLGLGAFPGNKLDIYTTTGAGGFNNGISIRTEPGTYTSGHGGMLQFQNEDVITAGIRGIRTTGWGSGMAFYVHNESAGNTFGTTFVERIRINEQGNVGIGTTTPTYLLDVAGTIRATGDVIAYSDARVKTNVKTIESPLEIVSKLRGVTYNRIDIEDKSEKVGVIAQEVLEVLPQVVQQDHEGNYSVAYGNIVGVLIEAIKELKAEIDELKNNKQ